MPGPATARRRRADLINDIYDAAVDGEAWHRLGGVVSDAVGGETAVGYIAENGAVGDFVSHNLPGEALARYGAYYHTVDPLLAMSQRSRAGRAEAIFSYALLPERDFAETEFYRDFAREVATFHMLGCSIPIDAGRTLVISAQRPVDAVRFERDDKVRFDGLVPHLQRMLQLRGRLSGRGGGEIGLASLDALAFGAVVCEANGRVRFANAAAEQMARSGTGLVLGDADGGISAAHGKEGVALALLIADAAQGGAGGGMALSDVSGGILLVLVAPLPRRFIDQPWLSLVTLRPSTASPTVSDRTLAKLFGLTPAEARLALALLAGQSLAEFGAERRVTDNTLRTQLAKVLRKTDTANQSGLMRLLGLLPPLL